MILVTGSSGFVGQSLCETLISRGFKVRKVTRDKEKAQNNDTVYIDSIGSHTDWTEALDGVDTVIHLAARVHVLKETEKQPLDVYREVNTFGTLNLAKECLNACVKKFIFLSTIGVNGNLTEKPFSMESKPAPVTPYAISKFEAEIMLRDLYKNAPIDLVILRSPLIYGPQARGNFFRIMSIIQNGIPLPLGAINNKRTFLYINNLIDLIVHILSINIHINDTFLVGDKNSISTSSLIKKMSSILNKNKILVPVPIFMLRALGLALGKSDEIHRLTDNLEIDTTYTNNKLNWYQPFTSEEGLKETAKWFKECTK